MDLKNEDLDMDMKIESLGFENLEVGDYLDSFFWRENFDFL